MDLKIPLPVPALPQAKANANQEETKKRKNNVDGLVGLVNIGNSCYMNATLQALSNCPQFRQYFIECHHPLTSSGQSFSTQRASDCLAVLFKKMWASERPPGHLSPRLVSSAMKNKMFRGSQQQDAQEFLRCLLTQIHDEIGVRVPPVSEGGTHGEDSSCCHRNSMVSYTSHDSECSNSSGDSHTKLVGSGRNSPMCKQKPPQGLSLSTSKQKLAGSAPSSAHNSPSNQPKFSFRGSYTKILGSSSVKSSTESINKLTSQRSASQNSLSSHVSESPQPEKQEPVLKWAEGDVFVADLITRTVSVHRGSSSSSSGVGSGGATLPKSSVLQSEKAQEQSGSGEQVETQAEEERNGRGSVESQPMEDESEENVLPRSLSEENSGVDEREESGVDVGGSGPQQRAQESTGPQDSGPPPPKPGVAPRSKKRSAYPHAHSIVSEIFEGILESRVKCLACKKVSVTREPFQDLSLPIPGRKEMVKFNQKLEGEGGASTEEQKLEVAKTTLSRGFCTVWNFVTALTRDLLMGPPTEIADCLNAFFDTSELKGDNQYYCTRCKSFQNSLKEMSIVKLPEMLGIHLKRFRFDAYFSSKISRHITFPLTDLNMASYLKEGSKCSSSCRYELSAIVTHYGGAGGGHYVAFAKNGPRNAWFEFNDTHVRPVTSDTVQSAEGYVLFYRRMPPEDSQACQPFELASLLPRPGTVMPSPDVCYISRHWLHLFRHCAHPGPIFQYEYACKHGAVLPTRAGDARPLAMAIRRDAWDSFQQRYGGGPLVGKLEVCPQCHAHLKDLAERRKQEKEDIHTLQAKEHKIPKIEPFLLAGEWLQRWQKFIHCTTLELSPPGPVDNSSLLQVDEKKGISVVEGATFRKLSHTTWSYFIKKYGGGPTVVTSLEQAQAE